MDFFQRLGNFFGGKGWVNDDEKRRREQQQAAPQPQPQQVASQQQPSRQQQIVNQRIQAMRSNPIQAQRQRYRNEMSDVIQRANAELNTGIDDTTGYYKQDADKLREELNKGDSANHAYIRGLLQSVQNRRKEIGEQRAEEQRMRQRIAANPNERRSQQQIDESINNWRDTDILVRSKGTFNAQENREKLQLRDVRLGAADNNQTVGGIIDDIKGSSGIDQQKKFEALDSKIKDLREAFTDEDVYRRDLLIHTRNEAEKHRRNDLGSVARGVVKGMTVDTFSGAGDGVAMAVHAADGSRERLAKSKQVTADYYNRELQKAIQNGDEQRRAYYSQELNRENREISRILGRQVEESDPIKNAGRIANAAALPVSFAAQSTGAGVAVKAGVTGSGATRAATTSIGKLVESHSPQLTGRLAQTATGKVLNSTPAQLVSRVLPKASPRLQAVAAESMANVLSGVPQGVASTAAEAGSRGRLEDYLINSATGAVMDAAFPVAAYGAGRGVHYMGKGAKYLSGRVQALDYDLKTQALQRSLVSDSMKPVNTKITNLMDYEGAPDRARVNEYKQAIQNGQDISPLLVMRDDSGKWSVEDGKHRLQAYRELGMKRVPVLPVDKEKLSRVLPEYDTQQLPVSARAEHPAAASMPYASAASTDTVPADTTTYSPLEGGVRQSSGASDGVTPRHGHTPYESDNPSVYTAGHASQGSVETLPYDTSVARDGRVASNLQEVINDIQNNPKPRMTRALRQAIDDEIYLSHPQLFNEEMTNIQGNGADWGIPRIHVDDLRHYLGDLTEDIPVTYRRTSGKRDIDVIAQEMGYSEVDEFLNELQRAAEARRTVRENKQLLAELRRNPEIINKAQEKLAKQEQEMAAEVAAKRQQAVTEIDDLLRERRKYAEQADAESVAQIDETVELLRQEGGLKSSEIDAMRRDIEASNRRENLDAEYAPKENTSTTEELRPAGDAKFGNLNGDHIITGGNLHKQTKVGVDDITDRPVQDGEWEYRQHKKRRYNEKTKKWESFQQFERRFIGEGSDGKWKPYSKAAYTWYKDPNIDKLAQDEKIAVATEMARKEGNVYDFMAVRQPRYDKRGYVIGEETVVKPIEDYGSVTIDGGLVRDVKSGDVIGSHVQVTPFGAVYQIEGKMAILEEDAFRTMNNKSGVFDTFARASEKNAGENAEMFHNLIDEGRSAQANAKIEQVEVKTIAAKAADDALQYKPRKMSTNGFFRALGEYIENKVPMADEINGELVAFKTKEEAFEHWYGKDALEGARRYDETMRSLYDRLINEANEVRRRLGQKEIEYRKDYMAHIWDDDGVITEWLRDGVSTFGIHGDFAAAGRGKIPAWIAGRSDMTKPMKRFNQHELSRKGAEGYILDPRVAFERASDAMILNTHLEPVIAKGRSMAAAISALDTFDREMMGTKKEFARYVSEDLENGGLQPIKNVASDQRVAITDFVNALAGKSSRFDREMLNSMPKTMRFIRHAEAVNGANKIMGNLSSVLAQALNLPGTVRENGFKNAGWAIAHVNSRAMKNAQSRSPFLTERYTNSTGRFEKSKWQSTREFVSKYTAMDITENTFVRINWTANYARLKKQGLRGRELILQTDRATARAVGDRSIGAMPQAYQSAIGKMFLQFTYELNENWKNDLSHMRGIAQSLKSRDLKKATRMSVTGAEALATGMAMNWLYKEVTGHAPLPDPVGAIMDVVANAQKDDEDESKRNPLLYGITSGVAQFAKANPAAAAVVNTIPKRYREDIFGKDSDFGRFDGATGVAQTGANFIGAGHYALEGKWDKAGKSVLGVVPMGSQIKKTLSGYDAMSDGTIRTESGKVINTVDKNDPVKLVQALAFGKNALKETQDGYKRTTGFLSEDQTKTYDEIRQKFGEDTAKAYMEDVHRARAVNAELKKAGVTSKSGGGNKSAELAQAEASIKMKSGEWREENGLMVDKNGNVQKEYHKALAQRQGESDEAYANWMKAYNIDKAGEKPRKKSDNPTIAKLQEQKSKVNTAATAVAMLKDEKYRDLPDWVKKRYYEKAGYKKHEVEYAAMASFKPKELLEGHWIPRAKELSHDQLMQELTNGRRQSIAGRELATPGIIDNLMREGYISRDEARLLKRAKFAHDGTPKQTASQSSGRGGGRSGRGRRAGASSQSSTSAIMSAYKQSLEMSKNIGARASSQRSSPQVGRSQMQKATLRRWSSNGATGSRQGSRKRRKP